MITQHNHTTRPPQMTLCILIKVNFVISCFFSSTTKSFKMKFLSFYLGKSCSFWFPSYFLLISVLLHAIWCRERTVYHKNSKIWDTSNNCHNCPKNRKAWCNIELMHPKDADGMTNSVDPDQTASSEAVWSWSPLFSETYLSQYIEFVR